MTMCLSKERWE